MTAHGLNFGQQVSGEDDPVVFAQFSDQLPDFSKLDRVQAGGRFIQDDHRRIVQDRLSNADPLPIALG